ncbi:EF-P lysine aminoacylase EpmA [Candidatus Pseudothioglobus sp. Uisw_016]|uniref:EF-P lysine aminoacylase EpmA n=1 Tax=Candidatus Pseudothioglobus sp. Uisw_016 TaxID=3230995 RepID=UPI003A847566
MSKVKKNLVHYQDLIIKIREFFYSRKVTEVKTPSLLLSPSTDVYIDSIEVKVNRNISRPIDLYLHTSPELEMKRLLSKGSGDIFQICQVYRDNEYGSNNSNEFTMLEFYRIDFDMHSLVDEIIDLLKMLGKTDAAIKISYAQAFFEYGNIDILNTDLEDLKKIANSLGLNSDYDWIEDLQTLLFVHLIEPKISQIPICFIYDYPKEQSALAKIDGPIAHRFELYINGVEIANGYEEIQSADEYRDRFNNELYKRKMIEKKKLLVDEEFLRDIKVGLPHCSGVAIGIERLFSSISL